MLKLRFIFRWKITLSYSLLIVYFMPMGEGSLGHFSERLYRRDFGQIEILGENWHFRWGWFVFMWDLKIHCIKDSEYESQAKKVIPIVISTTSHFWCTNKFLVECIFILISMVYTPPNHHFFFFFWGWGVKFFFRVLQLGAGKILNCLGTFWIGRT